MTLRGRDQLVCGRGSGNLCVPKPCSFRPDPDEWRESTTNAPHHKSPKKYMGCTFTKRKEPENQHKQAVGVR